ncbi:MAG: NTP transferase domain-containing protein [Proteobacteria bacterium]|nr:NTP transferase domain-containing protein [Pseudomonadota bacterium]
MTTKVMILAAGRGTRLKELTANTPKPLVPVAGVRPLLRTLGLLDAHGVKDVVMNLHYLGNQIEQAVAESSLGLSVTYTREEMLLDTGGGIKHALPLLGDKPFMAINGDVIWDEENHPALQDLLKKFDGRRMDACLLVVPLKAATTHKGRGDFFIDGESRLTLRKPDQDAAPYVYTGIQILHPRFFDGLPDGPFPLVEGYRRAQEKGRLFGQVYEGTWVDMGTPEGMEAAARLLQKRATAPTAEAERLSA